MAEIRRVILARELFDIYRLRHKVFAIERGNYSFARPDGTWRDRLDDAGTSVQLAEFERDSLQGAIRMTHRVNSDFPGGDIYKWRKVAAALGIETAEAELQCFLLDRLVVEEKCRRLGTATRLTEKVMDLVTIGSFVITATEASNATARNLFERLGWTEVEIPESQRDRYVQYYFERA